MATMHFLATEVYFNFVESRAANPARREKDLGERAAIEAIHDAVHPAAHERALLITEDDRVLRRVPVPEAEPAARMIPITTRDFLDGMAAAGRINAAEEVYRRAEDAGRLASRRATLADQHAAARGAVERQLRHPAPA